MKLGAFSSASFAFFIAVVLDSMSFATDANDLPIISSVETALLCCSNFSSTSSTEPLMSAVFRTLEMFRLSNAADSWSACHELAMNRKVPGFGYARPPRKAAR